MVSERILTDIERHLHEREKRRHEISEEAHQLRRAAQRAMAKVHQGGEPLGDLVQIRRASRALANRIRREGRGDEGIAHDALQESVEATLLLEVCRFRPLSGPGALGVEPEVWLSGLGDLVGEIRRLVLARLSEGDLPEAERFLRTMEEAHHALMRFETTRSIVPLKPKQDTSRALLERTRGDVTLARLLDRLEPHGGRGRASTR